MKCAAIIYHSNAHKIYEPHWIERCVKSIKAQTFKDFDVYEINYGGDEIFYFNDDSRVKIQKAVRLRNHIAAMNYLIGQLFEHGYDVIFNTNLDDYFAPERFEKQIIAINQGHHLISSNFYYYNDTRGVFKKMDMHRFSGLIGVELEKNHNIIAHPVVAMHRKFFELGLQYKDLLGYEDLELWKRAQRKGISIKILPDYLLYYRIHEKQITQTYKGI